MRRILIHFDTDPVPNVFDRVVAIDSGVDELFSYGGIAADNVEPLVHGAMFTRGPAELKNTAIFVGGSRVEAGEELFERVRGIFFGPMRVSAMMDSNGSNTTAAAAVLLAKKHIDLKGRTALVLGGTGPVGQRAAQLLAREGAIVRVGSRSRERATATAESVKSDVPGSQISGVVFFGSKDVASAGEGVQIVIAAGAAGARLLSAADVATLKRLEVAIDLNAVPPAGIAGIEILDKAVNRQGVVCYGAIGVGGTKMKIHKACVARLFESNDQWLDTEAIYRIGETIVTAK